MGGGRAQRSVLAALLAGSVLAGCYAGPGTQPLADAVAEQCAQARAMDALISVGQAFVTAVERGDRDGADALVTQAQDLWFEASAGIHAQPEGSATPAAFWERQRRLTDARARFELFKAVIAATPREDAAAGTARMLPEMRGMLATVDLSECVPVEPVTD